MLTQEELEEKSKMFRIWIYLDLYTFLQSIFLKIEKNKFINYIFKEIAKQSNKKHVVLASQCRVGLLFILKYLKSKSKKKEIILCAYNLPEMVNVAVKLNYNIKFCDLNYKTGVMDIRELKKKISKNTAAIVLTNMFNNSKNSTEIKNLASKYKITLIEDNAIYFDNFTKKNNSKIFSGSFGDFSIYSFNIMKNISSFYGGAISTNDKEFKKFYEKEYNKLNSFPKIPLLKQILIFLVLKIMSSKFLFKIFFLHVIRFAHLNNLNIILKLLYPSLKSLRKNLPNYYYSKMSDLSVFATYLQLKNVYKRKKLFKERQIKHTSYFRKITKLNKNLLTIKITDKNFQNYLDFPILIKNKKNLNKFLLNHGIEVRYKHYYNCEKLFRKTKKCINAERYENELICLPLHSKISQSYMDRLINKINQYHSKLQVN